VARSIGGKKHAVLDPEGMRSYLLEHPLSRGGRMWCDRVIKGAAKGSRTELRLFAEAMKWVGATTNIAAIFVQQLGVRDEKELGQLVEAGKRFRESMNDVSQTPEELGAKALELLLLCCPRSPGLADEAMKRLVLMSTARMLEEPSGNGDGR
jgi:hypothetical protein